MAVSMVEGSGDLPIWAVDIFRLGVKGNSLNMDFWFEEIFPMCISCPQLGGGRELIDKAGHEEIK